MILTTNYDHEVAKMSEHKSKTAAVKELESRKKAQAEHYGSTAKFTASSAEEFTVQIDDINYHVTERFFIVKE